MQNSASLLRYVLFCLFFTVGASAIVLSILAEELIDYYRTRDLPSRIEDGNQKLRDLASRYDQQIEQIRSDPEILQKLGSIIFRTNTTPENTVAPIASEEQLSAAREAMLKKIETDSEPSMLPRWLLRVSDPVNGIKNRLMIFLSGMGEILVTFIFFGSPRYSYKSD